MANNNNTNIINAKVLLDGCRLATPYGPEHIKVRRLAALRKEIITGQNFSEAIESGDFTILNVSPEKILIVKETFSPENWAVQQEKLSTLFFKIICALNSMIREDFEFAFARLERLEKCMFYSKRGEYEITEAEKNELERLKALLEDYDCTKAVNLLSRKISIDDVDQLIDDLSEVELFKK